MNQSKSILTKILAGTTSAICFIAFYDASDRLVSTLTNVKKTPVVPETNMKKRGKKR